MRRNPVALLYDQQTGHRRWKDYGAILPRFQCHKDGAYTQLLEGADGEDLAQDTPIFACKFALQPGHEHILALANEDGKLAVHNCKDNSRFGALIHNNAIFDLAWTCDRMKLVTASGDHTARLIDVHNGELKEETVFYGHTRSVKTVAFRNNDSTVFSTGGRDGNIILWDTRTVQSSFVGRPDQSIANSHVSRSYTPRRRRPSTPTTSGVKSVTGLVFQDDNTLISCGAGDGIIKAWDLRRHYSTYKNAALPKFVIPHSGRSSKNGFSSLIVDQQGIKLYANCLDNSIYCYNIGTFSTEPVRVFTGHQNSSFYIKSCLSRDGDYLMSGSSDGNAYIWSTECSNPLVKLVGHTAEVTNVAWNHSGNCLVTCSDDMTHKLWTIGREEKPDDWNVDGRGQAEILPRAPEPPNPLKRLPTVVEGTPKKMAAECGKCAKPIAEDRCENCATGRKRKASEDVSSSNELFGPKRLFTGQPMQSNDILATRLEKEEDEPACRSPNTSRFHDFNPASPTMNLPNYVVDGVAPHINYSPPKKRNQDWLTRLRMEKKFKREMQDGGGAEGSAVKLPKLEMTPSRKRCASPKSPLLKYFKVTNGGGKTAHSCGGFVANPSH